MAAYNGKYAWPGRTGSTPIIDIVSVTPQTETGFARGGTVDDKNVVLRGLGQQVDDEPTDPYP